MSRLPHFPWCRIAIPVCLSLGMMFSSSTLPAQLQEMTTEDWIEAIDAAFDEPEADLLPSAAVFPMVDETGKICENGYSISLQANFLYEYAPERKSHSAPCWYDVTWRSGGESRKGRKIGEEVVELYASSLDADFYYFPSLTKGEEGYELVIDRADRNDLDRQEILRETVTEADYLKIPGVIALAIYDDQAAQLTEEERKYVSTPQLVDREAANQFEKLLQRRMTEEDELVAFFGANAKCEAAWQIGLWSTEGHEKLVSTLRAQGKEVNVLRILSAANEHLLTIPETDLLLMLKRIPSVKTDPVTMKTLLLFVFTSAGVEPCNRFIERWEEVGDGYPHFTCLSSGINRAAWIVRGNATAAYTPPAAMAFFSEWGTRSYKYCEDALALNPDGWSAHLLGISAGTEWGGTDMARPHYEACVKLRPRCRGAWIAYFRAMQPRWGGQPDESLEFALDCVETEAWDLGIPSLGFDMLLDLADPAMQRGFVHGIFADERVWEVMRKYYESSQESDVLTDKAKLMIKNQFVLYGAYGQRYEEVGPIFLELREKKEMDFSIFYDAATRSYILDQIRGAIGTGTEKLWAQVENALCVGDFDTAQSRLDELKVEDAEAGEYAEDYARLQGAIDLGRELLEKREITITPQLFKDTFFHMSSNVTVDGNRIKILAPKDSYLFLLSPFGFQNAVVSGDLSFRGQGIFNIIVNSRANRDQVRIYYHSKNRKAYDVRMFENFKAVTETEYGDTSTFQILKTPKVDVLVVDNGEPWKEIAYDPSISGFGFYVRPLEGEYEVNITNLKIKLIDVPDEQTE